MAQTTLALLFGGRSSEHEISAISARSIAMALDRTRYQVVPFYIAHDGRWFSGKLASEVLQTDLSVYMRSSSREKTGKLLKSMVEKAGEAPFDLNFQKLQIDVAFIALHGSYGEDGRIQGFLDTLNIPYTGCGLTASAITMDKALTKLCIAGTGVATAPSITLWSSDYRNTPERYEKNILQTFGFPLFVKPASLGSSVGISKVHSPEELAHALTLATGFDRKVLVEVAMAGREIEVAVLGNKQPIASVPGEIEPGEDFYDFEDKYIHNSARLFIPARIPREVQETVRQTAITVYKALDCSGMARIDFFVDEKRGSVVLNEINTIPGFTDISMYPQLLEASGIPFAKLIDRLVHHALETAGNRSEP